MRLRIELKIHVWEREIYKTFVYVHVCVCIHESMQVRQLCQHKVLRQRKGSVRGNLLHLASVLTVYTVTVQEAAVLAVSVFHRGSAVLKKTALSVCVTNRDKQYRGCLLSTFNPMLERII